MFVPSLKSDVLAILKNTGIADSYLKKIEKCFDKHSRIFDDVASESKRFTIFKKKGFLDFQTFTIGRTFVEKLVNNDVLLVPDFFMQYTFHCGRVLNYFWKYQEFLIKF